MANIFPNFKSNVWVRPTAGPPAIIRDGNSPAWYLSDDPNMVIKDGADRVSFLFDKANYATTNLMDAGKGTFDSGTENWAVLGTNTITNDNGALKITYVDNQYGARVYLSELSDLSTDLVVGKTYRIRAKAKVNTGSSVDLYVSGPSATLATVTATDFTWYEGIFVATFESINNLRGRNMGAGEILWIDEWYIEEIAGNHLIQLAVADQPLWSVDGVLFDGVSEFMQTIAFGLIQPSFIYIVFRQITWSINDFIFDGSPVSSTGRFIQDTLTPGLTIRAGGLPSAINNNLALNTFGIARALFNGAASTFQINETPQLAGNYGANNMDGFSLGARGDGGANWSNIEVKETILRNIADTAPNQTIIYNYLANKYSI